MTKQDRGTWLDRMIGWFISYPVRFLVAMFVLVVFLTLACGV